MGMEPKALWLELTEHCNLCCPHCLVRRPDQPGYELDLRFYRVLLAEATRIGFRSTTFTGGEPLLHSRFHDIYEHAHRSGLSITVNTNGTCISTEIAQLWNRFRPRAVKISFYGHDESTYDTFVGRAGSHRQFEKGIALLRALGVPFRASVAPHPQLLHRLDAIRKYARALGCSGPVNVAWNMLLHTRDGRISEQLRAMRLDPERAARAKMSFTDESLQDLRAMMDVSNQSAAENLRIFHCAAAKDAFCVSAFGLLQPCRLLRSSGFTYDLKKGSLLEGVLRLHFLVMNATTRNKKISETCGRCILRPACSSCPATSWMESGVVDEPVEYYCEIAHLQAGWLGILRPGEKGWAVQVGSRSKRAQ